MSKKQSPVLAYVINYTFTDLATGNVTELKGSPASFIRYLRWINSHDIDSYGGAPFADFLGAALAIGSANRQAEYGLTKGTDIEDQALELAGAYTVTSHAPFLEDAPAEGKETSPLV